MLEMLVVPLRYGFFVAALFVGAATALIAALLGTHLTFKGFSMIGDGLSHVGFGTIAIAVALGAAPLQVAVPVVVLTAVLLLSVKRKLTDAAADSSVAMLSAAGLAAGVIAVSLAGTNFDLNSYLFGSVLAVGEEEVVPILMLCAVIFAVYLVCYPAFFALTFDEEFFEAKTHKATLFRALLASLAAACVVVGMQSVGALLISALLIFPPSAAKHLARSFRGTVVLAGVFSVLCFVVGLFLSYHLSLPAGGAVVLTNAALYLVCLLFGKLKK
ncbi:MAG: metal ABC transporter permease [Clostridia bacterium]|nr:metal ABC transporter permease [Clostridia bacterium]